MSTAANSQMEQVIQFFFSEQWCALRSYCTQRDIRDSWRRGHFCELRQRRCVDTLLNSLSWTRSRKPTRVSGVPPDYFSATGQRWGNPLYKWGLLTGKRGFDWWVARIRRSLALYDMVRLDHFRGFEAFWSIAAEEQTAMNGQWVKAPGHELFKRLERRVRSIFPSWRRIWA